MSAIIAKRIPNELITRERGQLLTLARSFIAGMLANRQRTPNRIVVSMTLNISRLLIAAPQYTSVCPKFISSQIHCSSHNYHFADSLVK